MIGKNTSLLTRRTAGMDYFSFSDEREKLRVDYRWISSRRFLLAKKYSDMYVAVKNKRVLFAEKSVFALLYKLRRVGLSPNYAALEFVSEKPDSSI